MAEGGDPVAFKDKSLDDKLDNDGDDKQEGNTTQPFRPRASTPYHRGEQHQMQTFSHEQSGFPSFDETVPLLSPDKDAELRRRLQLLRFNSQTELLDRTQIPTIIELPEEFKQYQIKKAQDLILKRYPHAMLNKLVLEFSKKNPMALIITGPRGGETEVLLKDGSDLQSKFTNASFVKNYLGPSAESETQKISEEITKKQKELKDLRTNEKILSDKNEEKESLIEKIKMEQAKIDQLKEGGGDNETEIKRKQQLVKNLENDLKSKKKDVKELEKKNEKTVKHKRKDRPT